MLLQMLVTSKVVFYHKLHQREECRVSNVECIRGKNVECHFHLYFSCVIILCAFIVFVILGLALFGYVLWWSTILKY